MCGENLLEGRLGLRVGVWVRDDQPCRRIVIADEASDDLYVLIHRSSTFSPARRGAADRPRGRSLTCCWAIASCSRCRAR